MTDIRWIIFIWSGVSLRLRIYYVCFFCFCEIFRFVQIFSSFLWWAPHIFSTDKIYVAWTWNKLVVCLFSHSSELWSTCWSYFYAHCPSSPSYSCWIWIGGCAFFFQYHRLPLIFLYSVHSEGFLGIYRWFAPVFHLFISISFNRFLIITLSAHQSHSTIK